MVKVASIVHIVAPVRSKSRYRFRFHSLANLQVRERENSPISRLGAFSINAIIGLVQLKVVTVLEGLSHMPVDNYYAFIRQLKSPGKSGSPQ